MFDRESWVIILGFLPIMKLLLFFNHIERNRLCFLLFFSPHLKSRSSSLIEKTTAIIQNGYFQVFRFLFFHIISSFRCLTISVASIGVVKNLFTNIFKIIMFNNYQKRTDKEKSNELIKINLKKVYLESKHMNI